MFDLHKKLNKFYEDHVRLGTEEKSLLKDYREVNLQRLRNGLDKLEVIDNVVYPPQLRNPNQGSYAMHTLNQHPTKEYDIDIALIFRKDDLPATALYARKRIEAAFQEAGGNFKEPPKARTNAVTVWYSDGYHVDFAIYREYEANGEIIIEHAGSDWTRRDPMAVTDWFKQAVTNCSPSSELGATVDEGQMRRVVRWLKAFAKSRTNWDLPGGLIISALVVECYRANYSRDDIALYDTIVAIHRRLESNSEISHPTEIGQTLTSKAKYQGQVDRFKDKLGSAIEKLDILKSSDCTEEQALKAWHWVFQHSFWSLEGEAKSFEQLGELWGKAASAGATFSTPSGNVVVDKPAERSIPIPPTKFYGEE